MSENESLSTDSPSASEDEDEAEEENGLIPIGMPYLPDEETDNV